MLHNRRNRLMAVGIVAGLLATVAPVGVAHAATEPTFPSTSAAPVYLVDGLDNVQYAAGSDMAWNAPMNVHLSAVPMPDVPTDTEPMRLPAVADAEQYVTFISDPGSESTRSNWKAYGTTFPMVANQGVMMPNVTPTAQINGLPGQASLKASGGTFSLGVAYVKNNGLTVVSTYFTTINVDAGGTWKFATPAAPMVNTDVATTTTVSATPTTVEAGSTTTLSASVVAANAATVSGNVQFFEGTSTTPLGTVALSGGTASKIVNVGTVGAHNYHAVYVASTVSTGTSTTDTYLASTSADVTVTGTQPEVAMPPMAPSDNALNANTAHGATASYNAVTHSATLTVDAANNGTTFHTFVYSTATYLGDFAVAGGTITADVSMLDAGDHKMAITNTTTGDVVAWATFTKTDAAIDPSFTKQINADVANGTTLADGEFSLTNLSGSVVNLTNPTLVNGQSVVSGELGNFKVTDLRQVSKPGWNLSTTVADFTKGTDTIGKSALGIAPKVVSQAGTGATAPTMGAAQVSGTAAYPWDFAELAASAFSGVSTYNADLVFTAPAGKPAGTYSSTLTLTLISK